jgi:[ribosomal protein S5]-alanine N-acetyltransferase
MPLLSTPAIAAGAMSRFPQPILDLGDAALRPWRTADAADVERAYTDPQIQRWHARTMTTDEALAWVESWPDRWHREVDAGWAIVDASGLLGQISLRGFSLWEGFCGVSYWVAPAARGRRLATRALSRVSGWAFDELGMHRLHLSHSTLNVASCRVAVDAGFRLEGTQRSNALHADGWHDMHLHGRLTTDPD